MQLVTIHGNMQLREELELVLGASHEFDSELFSRGELTPVSSVLH